MSNKVPEYICEVDIPEYKCENCEFSCSIVMASAFEYKCKDCGSKMVDTGEKYVSSIEDIIRSTK